VERENRPRKAGIGILCFAVLLLNPWNVCAYPEIKSLDQKDIVFRQFREDVDLSYQKHARGEPLPPLSIFIYRADEDDDLLSIAARLNIPASSIATLNGISGQNDTLQGRRILIPNQKGIFVPLRPTSELERLMSGVRLTTGQNASVIRAGTSEIREFLFLPGEDFNAVERSFFLGVLFRYPLPSGSITSGYGTRSDPFSGHSTFHNGVDIAAPFGTEVIAARDGETVFIGRDEVLGLHIILQHEGGYYTVYGHLSRGFVELNQQVESGSIIGEVGTSGASTGPHLHFEIRKGATPQDPLKYIQSRRP
jgi:murein DD-endopeptidase MepM/ murein hydrolase activator NlpD